MKMRERNQGYVEFDEDDRIVFNEETEPVKRRRPIRKKRPAQMKKKHKFLLILIVILILYFSYDYIMMYLQSLLQQNPTIYKYYLYLENEIKNNTLKGVFFVAILGSLFFLVLPSEAIFVYYLTSTSYNPLFIILLMVTGNVLGLVFNYIFGWLVGEKILKIMFRKNFENYKNKVNNYGGYVLLFGNILPGPVEVLVVFFGGFKYKFKSFLVLSAYGRLIKYGIIFAMFLFFGDTILYYYNDFTAYFSNLKF